MQEHQVPLSKEEILYNNDVHGNDFYDVAPVHKAMDEYAKQECIAFAEWIPMNAYIGEDEYGYYLLENSEPVTIAELYTKFKEQSSK